MLREIDFAQKVVHSGAIVIIINANSDSLITTDNISTVSNWSQAWQLVDKNVGEKRRILNLNNIEESVYELDDLETYGHAGLVYDVSIWFNVELITSAQRNDIKVLLEKIRHLVVILNGDDLHKGLESLQKRWDEIHFQDFIVGPFFSFLPKSSINYYKPKGLTVIIEMPNRLK
jgi:hypothetical protein